MSNPTRVVIYTRVSTDEQAEEGHSLEAQLNICTAYAESRGWQIVHHFEDAGYSGSTDARPGFRRVMHAARRGTCDVVITHKLDRFSRNIVHILTHLRELNDLGVAYASASEDFDFTTPIGKVVLAILAAFAEWYLDNLSQETTKGKRARAEAGLWNGDPPFGYTHIDRSTLEINPEAAPGVVMAFEQYATGAFTDSQIAHLLNEQGYRTKSKRHGPRPWSKDAVRGLLTNRFYLGLVKYKDATYPGKHPAIITNDLFNQVETHRKRRYSSNRGRMHTETRVYPASGLLVCEECGTRLRGHWMRGERNYQDPGRTEYATGCTQTRIINAQLVEERLGELLSATILPTNWREEILARKNSADPAKIENARRRLNAQLRRAEKLFVWDHFSERDYLKERAGIEATLAELAPAPPVALLDAGEMLSSFGTIWKGATDVERKELLQATIDVAYVKEGDLYAVTPRPEYYELLSLSIDSSCGPDGI